MITAAPLPSHSLTSDSTSTMAADKVPHLVPMGQLPHPQLLIPAGGRYAFQMPAVAQATDSTVPGVGVAAWPSLTTPLRSGPTLHCYNPSEVFFSGQPQCVLAMASSNGTGLEDKKPSGARQTTTTPTTTQTPPILTATPVPVCLERKGQTEPKSLSVLVKREGSSENVSCSKRRRSDTSLEDEEPRPAASSYPINALIDVPGGLTRASRTSSLSSSLSSFRFGGSLSQLWAASLSSLSKIPNMKSTGNLNAEASLPSLGTQYFAFGGSLPELSLTSLTRLLPTSTSTSASTSASTSDTSSTAASGPPSLFTFVQPPLYVYPSQSHLATPFINASGSIAFGSFLSSGSSLCSTKQPESPPPAPDDDDESSPAAVTNNSKPLHSTTGKESSLVLPVGSQSPCQKVSSDGSLFSPRTESGCGSSSSVITSTMFSASSVVNAAGSPEDSSTLNPLAFLPSVHHKPLSTDHHAYAPATVGSPFQSGLSPIPSSTGLSPAGASLDCHHYQLANGVKLEQCDSAAMPGYSEVKDFPNSLNRIKRESKDRPYKCEYPGCGRSFSFPAHLRSHVQQIHISYRPCKCDFPECGKRFYTPQHLNVHRRIHTGERPFVCPYTECAKAFTTAGNLKNHIRTHTGERPYACKFNGCTKRFAEMSSLKKHELTHTGEKPYKCRVCGKAFSQAGSRNTHERKHSRTVDSTDGKMSRRYRIKRVALTGGSEEALPSHE